MNYLVIELQTTGSTTANIVTQYSTLTAAQQAFYTICAAAVVSTVEMHAVLIVDETGFVMMNESFEHPKEG